MARQKKIKLMELSTPIVEPVLLAKEPSRVAVVMFPGASPGGLHVFSEYTLFAVGGALIEAACVKPPDFWVVWDGNDPEVADVRNEYQRSVGAIPDTVGFFPAKGVRGVQVDASRGGVGLYATRVALAFGYRRVVLLGDPLVEGSDAFREGWRRGALQLDDRVRALSGWLMELLGKPTREWLEA